MLAILYAKLSYTEMCLCVESGAVAIGSLSASLYGEGRAAMLSATGVSTAELFSWAVYSDFGWVWYASEDHIIVAVRGSE